MKRPVLPPIPALALFGGLEGMRSILQEMYDTIYQDPMISYLFRGQDKARLVQRELEWTVRALGLSAPRYQGEGLAQAHQKHPIRRGHFHRRNQILIDVLQRRDLPDEVIQWWHAHNQALEGAILGSAQNGSDCEGISNRALATPQPSTSVSSQPLGMSLWGTTHEQ